MPLDQSPGILHLLDHIRVLASELTALGGDAGATKKKISELREGLAGAGLDLNDVFIASVGGAYLATADSLFGMYFDYREPSVSGLDDIQELSGFASFRLGRAWRMELYAFAGLTDSSTDLGGGILFSTDLRQLRVSDRQDY